MITVDEVPNEVLIVDDEDDDRTLFKRLLQKNCTVTTASCSEEALQAMKKKFNAVLVDIQIGPEDGKNLARELAEIDPEMAIIIMTGHPGNYRESMPGFDDYIVKGTNDVNLTAVVRNAVYKKRMPREIRLRRAELLHDFLVLGCKDLITNVYKEFSGTYGHGDMEKLVGKLTDEEIAWVVYNLVEHGEQIFTTGIVSTVGCIGGCAFCVHGEQKFVRPLECREMLSQVLHGTDSFHAKGLFEVPRFITPHVNFTCMGEPLSNRKEVMETIRRLAKIYELAFKFIVTTIGLKKDLGSYITSLDSLEMDLGRLFTYFSINSCFSEIREEWMPATRGQDIEALRDLGLRLKERTGNATTASFILIPGKNDRDKDIEAMVRLFGKGFRIKLQAFTPSPDFKPFPKATDEQLEKFKALLIQAGAEDVRIRKILGGDIGGGCGTANPKFFKK